MIKNGLLPPREVRQYALVTCNYWHFTVTDGAMRMLVVLHFYTMGYQALEIALLFLFYELFGVVTNLAGGWIGARIGLNRTMNVGLFMQIVALSMLALPTNELSVPWVMLAQALSGIAKDLNKMSAKSAIKNLVDKRDLNRQGKLYRWVALLTGSKNALKGVGFFLGGALLTSLGFQWSVLLMAGVLTLVLAISLIWLDRDLGRAKSKARFRQLFSKDRNINVLSLARLFLFGARDVWFVIALPAYLSSLFGWEHTQTGAFMAIWVIGYGVAQGLAPNITRQQGEELQARHWAFVLWVVSTLVALGVQWQWHPEITIVLGLLLFGAVFAINSSLHSYLIVRFSREDGASMDIGFYYSANAAGRLLGTVLSGFLFQTAGLEGCLWVSSLMLFLSFLATTGLRKG